MNAPMHFADADLRFADGFLCIFSFKSRESLQDVLRTRETILHLRSLADGPAEISQVPFVLLGTFSDTPAERREVTRAEVHELQTHFNCQVIEFDNREPAAAFQHLAEMVKTDNDVPDETEALPADVLALAAAQVGTTQETNDSSSGATSPVVSPGLKRDRKIRSSVVLQLNDLAQVPPVASLTTPRPLKRAPSLFGSSLLPVNEVSESIVLSQPKGDKPSKIVAATLIKLIEKLTSEKGTDMDFNKTFLLTYRSFCTPVELLEHLETRFSTVLPPDTEDGAATMKTVRLKVINVLKMWVDQSYEDFNDSQYPSLWPSLLLFLSKAEKTDVEQGVHNLMKLLEKKKQERGKLVITREQKPPAPLVTKQLLSGKFDLLDVDPLEVARQLTLIESEIFNEIESKECLTQAWNSRDKETAAPHITKLIARFNDVSSWVATEIVSQSNLKTRTRTLRRFIKIAHALKELNNLNGAMAIITGLGMTSIHRLKKTWKGLEQKWEKEFQTIKSLLSPLGSFKKMREFLHTVDPPCIPYLGVFLSDLTFIEDGSRDTVHNGLINFEKRSMVANVIKELQLYQQPYNLEVVPQLRSMLVVLHWVNEDVLYSKSCTLEPRESLGTSTISQKSGQNSFFALLRAPEAMRSSEGLLSDLFLDSTTHIRRKLQGDAKDAVTLMSSKELVSRLEATIATSKGQDFVAMLREWRTRFNDTRAQFVDEKSSVFTFFEVFQSSHALEEMIKGILQRPDPLPQEDNEVLGVMAQTMIGDPKLVHEPLLTALRSLAQVRLPAATLTTFLASITAWKCKSPSEMGEIETHVAGIEKDLAALGKRLLDAEMHEGSQDIALLFQKVQLCAQISKLCSVRRNLIISSNMQTQPATSRTPIFSLESITAVSELQKACAAPPEVTAQLSETAEVPVVVSGSPARGEAKGGLTLSVVAAGSPSQSSREGSTRSISVSGSNPPISRRISFLPPLPSLLGQSPAPNTRASAIVPPVTAPAEPAAAVPSFSVAAYTAKFPGFAASVSGHIDALFGEFLEFYLNLLRRIHSEIKVSQQQYADVATADCVESVTAHLTKILDMLSLFKERFSSLQDGGASVSSSTTPAASSTKMPPLQLQLALYSQIVDSLNDVEGMVANDIGTDHPSMPGLRQDIIGLRELQLQIDEMLQPTNSTIASSDTQSIMTGDDSDTDTASNEP
eukprot:TRINITY_DN5232_c0_g1_i1.p1 TRINITY_DN5232_c0_g1~~TRINITY_DN5232_c0_g1_i1.p1  ORF type:complete len:1294 (+),score=320.90 TRINITY_DN5232_c0_g1_i1:317-3883(+)